MGAPIIRFPRLVGRSYGFRTLPITLAPKAPDTSPKPLPLRGAQPDTTSAPASRRQIDADSGNPGRSYFGARTEDALNLGAVPAYIDRRTPAANAGDISTGAGPDGIAGWPYDGNALFIPHQYVPRKPITGALMNKTIDTSVVIPAVGIGAPLR